MWPRSELGKSERRRRGAKFGSRPKKLIGNVHAKIYVKMQQQGQLRIGKLEKVQGLIRDVKSTITRPCLEGRKNTGPKREWGLRWLLTVSEGDA